MATVRMSNDLRYQIKKNIERPLDNHLSELNSTIDRNIQNSQILAYVVRQEIPAQVLKDMTALTNSLEANAMPPKRWLRLIDSVNLRLVYKSPDGQEQRARRYTLKIDPPIAFRSMSYSDYVTLDLDKLAEHDPVMADIRKQLYAKHRVYEENQETVGTVKEILDRSNTLKQALDIMPSILDFCPDNIRQRHFAKTKKRSERVREEREELAVDQTKINASLLKAKMYNSTN